MSIPAELLDIPQWLLWRAEHRGGPKPTKVPYSAHTRETCDATDPANLAPWTAVYNGHAAGFDGQGFSVQEGDGLTFIDLDDPFSKIVDNQLVQLSPDSPDAKLIADTHRYIIEFLDSYTELSPSGKGYRIVVRGKLPAEWGSKVSRCKLEVYSRKRFLTMTGNHVPGTPTTINDRQDKLEALATHYELHLKKTGVVNGEVYSGPQREDDQTLANRIANSPTVGPDFVRLWQGDISGNNNDHSSAELALANYIVAFTDNREQAERIFRLAPLTQRDKVRERQQYVDWTINKAFDLKGPPVNITIQRQVAAELTHDEPEEADTIPPDAIDRPEGLLGLIADFIYYSAPHPIAEFAVAGAIGLLSGICGRAYNINGDGLNQYIAMIGRSAIGKDAVPSGIAKLISKAEVNVNSARKFLGPRSIQSMQALRRTFDITKGGSVSYVSIINELGEWLAVHSDPKADATKKALMGDVMTIYTQSGKGQEGGSLAYADIDKNVAVCKSPSLSLIGDTVAGSFYEACTARNISKGLIPRFTIIEYRGPKPPLNEHAASYVPNDKLISCLQELIIQAHKRNEANDPIGVTMTLEAEAMLRAFTDECLTLYNESDNDAKGAIYGRAAVKAKKLAALVAVGMDWYKPCIFPSQAAYGINLARRDIANLMSRIEDGEIDTHTVDQSGDDPKQRAIARAFNTFVAKPFAKMNEQYQRGTSDHLHDSMKAMLLSRLRNIVCNQASFKDVPPSHRRRVFADTLDDMKNTLGIAPAGELAKNIGGAMQLWKMDADTQFVICRDAQRLKHLIGETKK